MTKKQLSAAQFLHITAREADKCGDEIDPKRTGEYVGRDLTSISRLAATAFQKLTGKQTHEVKLHELNTENPAPWAKAHKPEK